MKPTSTFQSSNNNRFLENVFAFGKAETRFSFLSKLLLILAQLGLLVLVMHQFRIEESTGFLAITPYLLAAFLAHSLIAVEYRLPFFFFLSVAVVFFSFGAINGALILGIGIGLLLICHIPAPLVFRSVLLLISGAVLVALRAEWIPTRWENLPYLVLPIIGSIFMFRLVIYLYDTNHERKPSSIWERLSYFFMFPNLYFLLFPVIDYQTYRRTYYNAPDHEIYQKGILWVLRGVVQLIFYRFIYFYVLPGVEDINGLGMALQYMLATYLLYLRISGQFHIIIGLLCLFGFNLPETHHQYFLATSLSDYWRRINIYWKDFMMKIFYYPLFMKFRKWGSTTALVISTLIVFVVTWLLHSYQWLWLQGTFPLTLTDALFWGVLGFFVVINALVEVKKGRKRSLDKPSWSFWSSVGTSLKVLGIFLMFTVLWTMWSSESIQEFASILGVMLNDDLQAYLIFFSVIIVLVFVGVLLQYLTSRGVTLTLAGSSPSFRTSAIASILGLLVLVSGGTPHFQSILGESASNIVASLKDTGLNARDKEQLNRGYYEGLLDQQKRTFVLQQIQKQPKNWQGPKDAGATRDVRGLMGYELIPEFEGIVKRHPMKVSSQGMHDKNYDVAKREDTYRIALLGASYEMGAGIDHQNTYQAIAEDKLNAHPGEKEFETYEILNMAVGGYSVINNLATLEEKVFKYQPDAVFYFLHSTERIRLNTQLNDLLKDTSIINDAYIESVIERSGANSSMRRKNIDRLLEPYIDEITQWSLNKIADYSRQNNVLPVAVFVPSTDENEGIDPQKLEKLTQFAKDAGFELMSLEGAYGETDVESIRLAGWDWHPNELGHELLGHKLYRELVINSTKLGLGLKGYP